MARFYIQQNLLTAKQPTLVKNAEGKSIFLLVGTWGTKGDALALYSIQGELIANVKQVSLSSGIGAKFQLYYHFEKVGSMKRIFSAQKDFYFIHQLAWLVIGDIPNHDYNIYSLQSKIMTMKKTCHARGNFYELDIFKEKDAPICICIASILDYWQLNRDKRKKIYHQKNQLLTWNFKIKP